MIHRDRSVSIYHGIIKKAIFWKDGKRIQSSTIAPHSILTQPHLLYHPKRYEPNCNTEHCDADEYSEEIGEVFMEYLDQSCYMEPVVYLQRMNGMYPDRFRKKRLPGPTTCVWMLLDDHPSLTVNLEHVQLFVPN